MNDKWQTNTKMCTNTKQKQNALSEKKMKKSPYHKNLKVTERHCPVNDNVSNCLRCFLEVSRKTLCQVFVMNGEKFWENICRYTHCGHYRHMATYIWVNIGSGNGLMPDGNNPLRDSIWWLLISEVLWHSLESNFTASAQSTILYNEFENIFF